jgi:hypothetical protein
MRRQAASLGELWKHPQAALRRLVEEVGKAALLDAVGKAALLDAVGKAALLETAPKAALLEAAAKAGMDAHRPFVLAARGPRSFRERTARHASPVVP